MKKSPPGWAKPPGWKGILIRIFSRAVRAGRFCSSTNQRGRALGEKKPIEPGWQRNYRHLEEE